MTEGRKVMTKRMGNAFLYYWRLSGIKCVGSGVFVRPPWHERLSWSLRWWRCERRAVAASTATEGPGDADQG